MSLKGYLLGGVAVGAAFASIVPAKAQSAATLDGQVKALQDQVRLLNQQLLNLQQQVQQSQVQQRQSLVPPTQEGATVESQGQQPLQKPARAQVAVGQAAPPPGASGLVMSMPNNRPTISTPDGRNSIALTGRIHYDMGDYLDDNPANAKVAPNNLNSGVNLRRGRIGVLGLIAGDWNYALIYDFGGSNDSGPASSGITANQTGGIEIAELSYSGLRPLVIEGGYGDLPYTLGEATSSNNTLFMERASSDTIAVNLAAGDFRSNIGAHWNNARSWIGVYGTGPQSGTPHNVGNQFGAVGRATTQLLQTDQYSLHVGVDAEGLIKPPTINGVRSVATFADRPELRIDTTSILSTGTIGTAANPVTGATVFSAEAAGGYGPAYAQAEYFHYNVGRQGLANLNFDGGYIEGAYVLTGEHRPYIPEAGAYGGITPTRPFDLKDGGWGAFELAARYSVVDLNDQFTGGVSTASTDGVAGGAQQIFGLGLNWYVNSNIRFMFDYLHGIIDKDSGVAATAPLGSGIGGKFDAIAVRTQVAW